MVSRLRQHQMESLKKLSEPGHTAADADRVNRQLDDRGAPARRAVNAQAGKAKRATRSGGRRA